MAGIGVVESDHPCASRFTVKIHTIGTIGLMLDYELEQDCFGAIVTLHASWRPPTAWKK